MSEPRLPPPLPRTKTRLPFEPAPFARAARNGAPVVYGVLVVVCLGVAAYMKLVMHMPLMSGYVIAPAIGSLWFALRLFMSWAARD